MSWMVAYNTVFDIVEFRVTGLVSSGRPHRSRIVHALGLEASSVLVTWPLIMLVTDLDRLQAMVANLGLTLAYAIYGYFFHLGFDRLQPVPPNPTITIDANQPVSR